MKFTRRRFISLMASVGACSAIPTVALADETRLYRWRGILMGAEARLQLYHPTPYVAKQLLQKCFEEIQRLEGIFSLYQSNSALSKLNRHGVLEQAPSEFLALLRLSKTYADLTDGAFDVSVQPLWEYYQNDSGKLLSEVLEKIDYRAITIEGRQVRLLIPGMKLTLNGIAQGFMTDRITELLKRRGVNRVLVELGETRALGAHPGGRPWRIGIQDPTNSEKVLDVVSLQDRALATSGGYGTKLGDQQHHLLDPRTGKSAQHYGSVSVLAPHATMADALSTGLSILPPKKAKRILAALPEVEGIFIPA